MSLPKRILKVCQPIDGRYLRRNNSRSSSLLLSLPLIPARTLADGLQETERLMSDSPPGISAAPKDDNLRHFDVSVAGPGQSPYEGELMMFLCVPDEGLEKLIL